MKKALSILGDIILWGVILTMLVIIASGIYQKTYNKKNYVGFFNTGYAVVVSGSMEPNLHVGEIIVYKVIPQEDYKVGDIIVYVRDRGEDYEMLITHRIVVINENTDSLVTKGDHNNVSDAEISFDDVIGKVIFHFYAVGKFASFLKTKAGIASLLAFAAVMFGLSFVLDRHKKKKKIDTSDTV